MMADAATIQARLTEAETALHELVTGTRRVMVRDADGRTVTYAQSQRGELEAYAESLRAQLPAAASGKRRRQIIHVRF
jgi:gpW protein